MAAGTEGVISSAWRRSVSSKIAFKLLRLCLGLLGGPRNGEGSTDIPERARVNVGGGSRMRKIVSCSGFDDERGMRKGQADASHRRMASIDLGGRA